MIRPMRVGDIEQIVAIEKETFSTAWSQTAFLNELSNPQSFYMVYEKEEQIVGYGGFWKILEEGHINNIAIRKDCRRQGKGKKLLEAMINNGRCIGIDRFTLEVRRSNQTAIQLYQKMGFVGKGMRPRYYQEPVEDALIMWLELA